MSFSFKQGTKLIVDDGTDRYQILVADFNFSETFIERGYDQATIHNPVAINSSTFTNSKSNATFQFDMFLGTTGVVERKILEWYGLTSTGEFPTATRELVKSFNLYIVMDNNVILIDNAVLENLSFKLDPRNALSLSVSGSGSTTVGQSVNAPTNGALYSQLGFNNYPLRCDIQDNAVSNLRGITLELTKSVQWINTDSVHNAISNTLYIPEYFVATNLSVSGSITKTKTNDAEPTYTPQAEIIISVGDYLLITLKNCNLTERVNLDSGVLTLVSDYKLLNALGSTIII
jgi:hypothetical protein